MSAITISKKKIADILEDKELLSEIYKLTLQPSDGGHGSMMRKHLYRWKDQKNPPKKTVAFLISDDDRLIGWSLLTGYGWFQVYVEQTYRQQGVGTSLVKFAKDYCKQHNRNFYVTPWDERSRMFFENLGFELAGKNCRDLLKYKEKQL